ncbi:acyl-[ACP]--phospholipid O-acyltransferase [Deltaproteobacteria bacterium Smac51]|nr:acyl-[ACP]--phospholipid O-acyltransferase [Deltaproteobacteria bacterium Smac51]
MKVFSRILSHRNFWPLFGAQALGAFNDNFFRSALIAYVAFGAVGGSGAEKTVLGSLATGLMMLPFFLFSSVAGELADRLRKSRLIKITKAAEVAMMILAAVFFYLNNIYALLAVLFLMGTQSAFFGPLKYGILPEILGDDDLVAGNGLIEAATFLSIVLGTLAGSWLVTLPAGHSLYLPVGLVTVASIGCVLAFQQPASPEGQADLKVNPRIWVSTIEMIQSVRSRRDIWLAILAISWFWAMGAILITQFPVLSSTVIGGTPAVNTFMVTMFALGVGVGSIAAQWLLKGEVSARLTPVAAAFLSLFLILTAIFVWTLPVSSSFGPESRVDLAAFLSDWVYVRLAVVCLLVSVTGGLFVVPLNALIQHRAQEHERARVIAANNIVNAIFICAGSLIVMALTGLGLELHHVFAFVALSAIAVAVLTVYFLPEAAMRQLIALIIKVIYRPRIKGLENLKKVEGGPALVVANHTSFLDVALLVAYIPRRLTFAVDSYWAQVWWMKPLLTIFKSMPVNPNQPLATRGLIDALNNNEMVVIFPEGRITSTGGLMKVYEGPALIAMKGQAPLLPVVIDGLQYSRFSRFGPTLRPRRKFTTRLTIMEPCRLEVKPVPGEKQKDHRQRAGEALFSLMLNCLFQARDHHKNLWTAVNETARQMGKSRVIIEDAERKPLTYRQFLTKSKVLGRRFAAISRPGENVGLMLPNSVALTASLFGLLADGRAGVMLNFSQGLGPMTSAIETAQIKTVVTSKKFLENVGLMEVAQSLPAKLLFLDELHFGLTDKIGGLIWSGRPAAPEAPAILVFTSGSEGKPKGVVLSHSNVLANVLQFWTQVEINEHDVMFNALPMFHAFGLTVGVMTPLLMGMRLFNYVSPLHTKIIPELIYDTRATVTAASDTFAAAWGRNANPYDLTTLKHMVVGAEKLKARTYALYTEKFGVRIIEGYGASETTPVIAVNTQLHYRLGTVGQILPGIEARVEPVPGVEKGGKLVVKGPNVMLGYLLADQPGVIRPPKDGWYDTGDIVEIDDEGYLAIKGRFKRFAKIGGEMVSLSAVEDVAMALWPGKPQVVIAMDDDAKGERLVYITDEEAPELPALWQALKEAGMPEIYYPRHFVRLPEIPVTPVGKINMPKLIEMAHEAVNSR